MSTIKVNNIEPASGTDITIPTGKNLVITDGLDANTITSGTLADARIPANALNSNVDLTNLSATNLTSGTVPDARFPATLPAADGSALTTLNASNISSGTISDARLPANALNSNVDLTNLSASNLTSGTLPDARFPATLPAVSGANLTNLPVDLTNLNASNLTSGTVPDARFPATLPAISGANLTNLPVDLTNLNATNLTSGTVPDARFPSVLPAVSGANLTNLPGGGGFIPLASSTWSSNVSSVDFTNVISSTYHSYMVFVANLLPTSDCNIYVQYLDASNNPLTGSYYAQHMMVRFQSFGGPAFEHGDMFSSSGFQMNGYSDVGYNEINGDMSFDLTINDPTRIFGGTNKMSYGFGQCAYRNGSVGQSITSNFTTKTTKYTSNGGGFRIYPSTGSLSRGFAVVYGYNS